MAGKNVSEDKAHVYITRYGELTADKATGVLLERSWARLCFLENVLDVAHQCGEGFTMKGYASQGLAAILEDVAADIFDVHCYHIGHDTEPGKIADSAGVRS